MVLAPFVVIIRDVQGDTATLADAYVQLRALRAHIASVTAPGRDCSALLAQAMEYDSGPFNVSMQVEEVIYTKLMPAYEARIERPLVMCDALPAAAILHPVCVRARSGSGCAAVHVCCGAKQQPRGTLAQPCGGRPRVACAVWPCTARRRTRRGCAGA